MNIVTSAARLAAAYLQETALLLEALEGAEPYCLDLVRSAVVQLQAFVDGV